MPKHSALAKRSAAASAAASVLLVLLSFLLVLLSTAPASYAQTASAPYVQREAPASVTGRVREGERGVAGIVVALMSSDPSQRFKTIARAKTDAEGRFRLSNVAPGRYQIMPFAPVYVVQGMSDNWPPGKLLTLLAGEEVSDIDFRVERGGVITGRVTDAEGNPIVAEFVSVASADNDTQPLRRGPFDQRDQMTDDRGVYRIYGLPAGNYRVSVGQSDERGAITYGRRKVYRRTFYPEATEAAQARLVEVKPGSEATGIDITLGRAVKTYRASGRFVFDETGQPAPNIVFGYGTLDPTGQRISSTGGGLATNARGEFQTEGLTPGRYAVFAQQQQDATDFYSDIVSFEVADADVTGVVVRLKRGVSVSGIITIEGLSDRAAATRLLSQVRLFGFVESSRQLSAPNFLRPPSIAPDGSFRLGGLRPGKLRIMASAEGTKGLTLSQVELNGANVTGGVDITEGVQLTGLRVRMTYGSAVLRGQVNFINGMLPPNARVMAFARRVGATSVEGMGGNHQVSTDARGLYIIEGLAAGEYEIIVRVFNAGRVFASEVQRVSLAEGGEMNITTPIDLSAAFKEGPR
jgi:protocatechuate 3,4-dioxygenase beta subunit